MLDTILFLAFAVAYLALLAWGLAVRRRRGRWVPADLALLVVGGLVYDNALLGLGRYVGQGALLEGLNAGRYWLHAFLTPLLVVVAWDLLRRVDLGWARARAAAVGAWVLAAALVVLEIVTVVAGLRLEPTRDHGVLSYTDAAGGGPPLMVVVVGVVLLAAGALLAWRRTWWWLLVGALVMVVGGSVPLPVESGAVTNLAELTLLVTVVASIHRFAGPAAGRR